MKFWVHHKVTFPSLLWDFITLPLYILVESLPFWSVNNESICKVYDLFWQHYLPVAKPESILGSAVTLVCTQSTDHTIFIYANDCPEACHIILSQDAFCLTGQHSASLQNAVYSILTVRLNIVLPGPCYDTHYNTAYSNNTERKHGKFVQICEYLLLQCSWI